MEAPNSPLQTLYVENLAFAVTQDLLRMLFCQFGVCVECKIIRGLRSDPYAFVQFAEHQQAQSALVHMHNRNVLGKELRVSWAPPNMVLSG